MTITVALDHARGDLETKEAASASVTEPVMEDPLVGEVFFTRLQSCSKDQAHSASAYDRNSSALKSLVA